MQAHNWKAADSHTKCKAANHDDDDDDDENEGSDEAEDDKRISG